MDMKYMETYALEIKSPKALQQSSEQRVISRCKRAVSTKKRIYHRKNDIKLNMEIVRTFSYTRRNHAHQLSQPQEIVLNVVE